ncbi:MAG: hypothetical protein QM674_08995 [Burkholderiaceae bacterium]
MSLDHSSRFLRIVLSIDAITCAAVGVLQVALSGLLTQWLGLGTTLLLETGWFLIGYAAFLLILSRSRAIRTGLLIAVIEANVVWGLGCLLLAFASDLPITALGKAYLCVQALSVFALAAMQWRGRRASPEAGLAMKST